MKLKIYIVDDEIMAIKYLCYILDHINLDYQLAGYETNSVRALSEIIRLRPDVAFLDIDMPVMDGLELAEKILKKLSVKIFMLTSYRDFDYVKKGMQIGVADYLLKNEITEQGLQQLLRKAMKNLAVERRDQHLVLEHNVRNFLLSSSDGIEDHIYEHRPMQRYALLYLVKRPVIVLRHQERENGPKVDCYELEILEYPAGVICSAFTEMPEERLCGIFFIRGEVTDGQEVMKQVGSQLVAYLEEKGFYICCLISDTRYHFLELQECYRELHCLADYIYAFPEQRVFQAGVLRGVKQERIAPDIWMESLDRLVKEQKSREAWKVLHDMFQSCRQNMDIWGYTECIQMVYRYLKSYVQHHHLRPDILNIPQTYENAEAVETTLLECLGLIFEEAVQTEQSDHSVYVQKAVEYIRRNYSRDISIPDIAEAAQISEGHLRRLFKQELGTKIVDYITDYRLECAKLLMKNKEDSLNEIWKKTGFTSAQYFSYVFKKKEGMLPRDYMKQLGRKM